MIEKEYYKEKKRCERILEKYPNKTSEEFLCLVPADPDYSTAFGVGRDESYDIFTEGQNGYNWAKERTPYFYKRRKCA